jgi:hypothetical protein
MREEVRAERRGGGFEVRGDDDLEALLDTSREILPRDLRQVGQPLGAAPEHPRDELLGALPVVVEPAEHSLEVFAHCRILLGLAHRLARGAPVEIVGLLGDATRETSFRGERQRVREEGVERIDGLDAQPGGALFDAPAEARGMCAHARRERQRELVRGRSGRHVAIECLPDALAHLASRLAGERDGEHLLGLGHFRE